jgi:hypothetical protein
MTVGGQERRAAPTADVMSRMPLAAVRTIVDEVLQRQLAGALPAAA